MKKPLLLLITFLLSLIAFSQNYAPIPYMDDFESGTGAEWLYIQNGAGNDQARVVIRSTNGPFEASNHLVLDNTNGGGGGYGTGKANLHLDLSSGTEFTLLFYFKDFNDEYDASEDGIFFRDSINSAFVKVFDIDGDDYPDNSWIPIVIDIDELALANGLDLTDSFTIQFSQADDEDVTDDGFCFDSIYVFDTPPFISGSISGSDTVCFADIGSSAVNLVSTKPSLFGEGNLLYNWQSSTDLSNWINEGLSIGADTIFSAPSTPTFYRRCASTDSGQGPLCTSPIYYYVAPDVALNIFGLDPTYCDNDASVTIFGNPINGGFSGTGITDNGNGTATFNPVTGGTGNRTITYAYIDAFGCMFSLDSITDIIAAPNSSFTGLNGSYLETDTTADNLSPNTSGGVFTGFGIVGNTFVPSNVGTTGPVDVTYTITQSGCTSSTTNSTNIQGAGSGSISGLLSNYCITDAASIIIGSPLNPGPYGFYSNPSYALLTVTLDANYSFTTNYTHADTAIFSPSANGAGNHTVHYYNSNTGASIFQPVSVHALPILSITGVSNPYCVSDAAISLTGYDGTTVVSGTFSGPGITSTTFDPAAAGPGTHNINFAYTDANGCTNNTNISIVVNPLPVVSFSGLNTSYCKDGSIDQLIGNPLGNVAQFSIAGTNFTNDTFNLDPRSTSLIGGTNYSVIYTYQDQATNCINSDTMYTMIDSLPRVDFTGLAGSYCEDADTLTLIGTGSGTRDTSFFFGTAISNTGIDLADFEPSQVLLGATTSITDTISFVYVDGNMCRDTSTQFVDINPLPVVNIFLADTAFCNDDNNILMNGTPSGGNFYSLSGLGVISDQFDPANAQIGIDTLVYQYTDGNTCTNFDSVQVVVLPAPIAGFSLSGYCNDDTITFTDTSTIQNPGVIGTWNWSFGDGKISALQNSNNFYNSPGAYQISLTVITDSLFGQQCTNTLTIFDTIGAPPVADFDYDNVCFGELIQFSNNSYSTTNVDPIVGQTWDFGDGTTATSDSATHTYAVDTVYFVSLSLVSQNNCTDTLVRRLSIRPVIDTYPYFEDFEVNTGGWFPEGATNGVVDSISWIYGIANGQTINDSLAGNTSWATLANGGHFQNEQSFVDGPCFDFTTLKKPMISMNIWSYFAEGGDGAVLQYSTDNGNNWVTVGSIGDGINWYNRTSISGNPGNQALNQVGWSYESTEWVEARHDLDMLAGFNQVRLRIAIGTDPTGIQDGFAFDNVWIGERSRVVLLEHFTNSSDGNAESTDLIVDDLVTRNNNDVVDIQYHVEFPGQDDMNDHSPSEPATRALYYSVFNTGRSVLNGNTYNDISAGLTDNHIKLQMLRDAKFNMEVDQEISGNTLTSRAKLIALDSINGANLSMHIAIVEKEITSITGDNGDTEFRSVLKKMIPSALGRIYTRDWIIGDEKGVEESWEMENVFDVNQLRVVAFVQDNDTKEVYQVAVSDSTVGPISLSVNDAYKEELKLKLLPNPAVNNVTIVFNQKVESPKVELIDQFGRLVNTYSFNGLKAYVSFGLDYPAGMYFVKTVIGNTVNTQKLIIEK